MSDEDGLDIRRAYDTVYGFILGQEVHVRAELFQSLDVLYHWARKGETLAQSAALKATGSQSLTSASVSDVTTTVGSQPEETARDG